VPGFTRNIKVDMEWVDGSAFDIVGALDDNVHSLVARLRVGFPDYIIQAADAEINRMPYPGFCQGATGALAGLIGARIGRGFRKRAGEVLGGAESCNHLHTLVNDMAACAFQMNYLAAKQRPDAQLVMRNLGEDQGKRREMVLAWMPQLRNSCYLFSEASDKLFAPEIKAEDGNAGPPEEPNMEPKDGKIL
jgi:hypothetical protein